MKAALFYARYSWFSAREQFSDWLSGVLGYLLFPFFLMVLTALWKKFNSQLGHYTQPELTAYVGIAEVFFMTFLRSAYFNRASGDFSLSLARPRSWLLVSGAQCFGRIIANRLLLLGILAPCLLVYGSSIEACVTLGARALLFLVPLSIIAALYNVIFASAQVLWAQTNYMTLPFTKVFLVFGGVFGPLNDYAEGARNILLNLPPADLFFQPAFFCVKGHFYQMTGIEWLLRLVLQGLVLLVFNGCFYAYARKHHQAFGG